MNELHSAAEDGRVARRAAGDALKAATANRCADGRSPSRNDLLAAAADRRADGRSQYDIAGAAIDRTADRRVGIDLHSAAAEKRDAIRGLSAQYLRLAAAGDLHFAAGNDRYPDGVAAGKDELDPVAEDGRVARYAAGDLFLSPGTNGYPDGAAAVKDVLHPAAEDGRVARHAQRGDDLLPTVADHRADGEPAVPGRAINELHSAAEDGRVARRAAGDEL
jgi:hypothetical protein